MQVGGIAPWLDRLVIGDLPERGQIGLVGPLGRQLAGHLLQEDAGLADLVQRGADPAEIEHHRVADRADRRLGDDEAAAWTAAGAGDPLMLHEPDRLAEDGAADAVAHEQVRLGAEHLAHRPTQCQHVFDDEVRNLRRPLGVQLGARARHDVRGRRRRHPSSLSGTNRFIAP